MDSSLELSESESESDVPLESAFFFCVFDASDNFLAAGFLVDSSSDESELELDDCLPLFFTGVFCFCFTASSSESLKNKTSFYKNEEIVLPWSNYVSETHVLV